MYKFLICIKITIFLVGSLVFCNQLCSQPIDKQLDGLIQSLDSLSELLKVSIPFKFDEAKTVQENLALNNFNIQYRLSGGYVFLDKINDVRLFYVSSKFSEFISWEKQKDKQKYKKGRDAIEKQIGEIKSYMTNVYKIHLMPKNKEQMVYIFTKILNDLKTDEKLKQAIRAMKFKREVNTLEGQALIEKLKFTSDLSQEYYYPLIVLYTYGKDNAQYIVDYVYKNFGNLQGLDKIPRYNEKVTSLIYFAQGGGDYKGDAFKQYYEQPNRVYYRSNFESPSRDYHLKNPALFP